MKLIIDIPEQMYLNAKADTLCGADILVKAIKNGIPLNKIRAEIEQIADEEKKHDEKWAIGLQYAVKIIDKYREDGE